MWSVFTQAPPKDPELTLYRSNPNYLAAKDLPSFVIGGVLYEKESNRATKKKKPDKEREGASIVWQFGEALIRCNDDKKVFYCYQCELKGKEQQMISLHGTSMAARHLKTTHTICSKEADIERHQQRIGISTPRYDTFRRLLIRWIVYCHIAFRMLENQYFRNLLSAMDTRLSTLLPKSSSTLRNWIKEEYDERKKGLIEELAVAISSVHLSFDIWTSPNHYSLISIFANYIDQYGQRQRPLLAFRRIYGPHTGEAISRSLLAVIREYNIAQKVGYFMSDNAKNNDTAVSLVLQALDPSVSAKQRQARRLRCFGHVVNLCAQALLLGKGSGKALTEVSRKEAKGDVAATEAFWKGKGALGQLHNIVVYIRCTPQRLEEFAKVKKGGNLAKFDELKVSLFFSNCARWINYFGDPARESSAGKARVLPCQSARLIQPRSALSTTPPHKKDGIDPLFPQL